MDKSILQLLEQAEAAAVSANPHPTIPAILQMLRKLIETSFVVTEAIEEIQSDPGLADDIQHYEQRANSAEAEGDKPKAKKNRNRAQLLKSAETLVEAKESGKEPGEK